MRSYTLYKVLHFGKNYYREIENQYRVPGFFRLISLSSLDVVLIYMVQDDPPPVGKHASDFLGHSSEVAHIASTHI